jgi:DNA-binding protein HU-beta
MTKKELVKEVSRRTGYEQVTILKIIENTLDSIKEAVKNDEVVYLRGFGAFSNRSHKKRIAQNIINKTSVIVPEHKSPHFKAYDEFKELLNNH